MTGKRFLVGKVAEVKDGDIFHVTVERAGEAGHGEWRDREEIKINSLKITRIASITGAFTRTQLERLLKGKRVRCQVRARDSAGRLLADVQVV